ncbi:MAG: PAS domain-containing protein [Rhodoferax sp.]|nr:PAS domain-containing protein [Rhodoferax sp.]MCF8207831.1 PAS domain-containing protein [Rhodoferax sp.]
MIDLARLMLDNTPEMLMLVDPISLQITMANQAVCKTLDYPLERLLGLAITEIESALPDVFYWEDVRNGQYTEIHQQEGQYCQANGELLTVSKSIRVLQQDGQRLMLVHAVQTQSVREVQDALAQTLSQLRATLESTGNGILVIDWRGRIESMNRVFSKMWGIPQQLLAGNDDEGILDFLANQVIESDVFRMRLSAIVDSGETQDLLHLSDGKVFEATSRPQFLGEQIIGRVFGFHDITERTLAERALLESRNLLEERVLTRTADLNAANETLLQEKERQVTLIRKLEEAQNHLLQSERMASIGQLAAGVAHEINNPIGFVTSNLGSLQRYVTNVLKLLACYEAAEGQLPAESMQTISLVKDEIDLEFLREDIASLLSETLEGLQRVTRIVRDLKDFSHVDESERQWADLELGLESTLRVVWNELKYKASVVKEFAGIAQIECFPFQMNQVFMNLLVNAAHAIEGSGTITVRTGQDDTQVWVEVEDTGKGIKPEHLGRIFEPFFTTKPVGKGTGLGLSLAYGIVQKHDGKIEVQSELGKGTCFKVVLPKKNQKCSLIA